MFRCEDINLIGFLRQEVSTEERETIRQHLSVCPDCQQELKHLEGTLAALKGIEEIEPSSNFTYRVMQEVDKVSKPLTLRERFSSLGAGINSDIQVFWKWFERQVRYAPVWLISTGVHIILFALLALILIGPTRQQLSDIYVVKLPPAKETVRERPEPIIPALVPKPDSDLVRPPSIWSRKLPLLDRFNIKAEEQFLGYIFARMNPQERRAALRKYGGQGVEKTVTRGLVWLNQTQETNGSWAVEKYEGRVEYKIGLTALALLSFLSEGNTSRSGPYRTTVGQGIKYLLAHQQPDGLIGPVKEGNQIINYMYNHAVATLVLLEDYYMTGRKDLLKPINLAVCFTLQAQNDSGGWGYQVRDAVNDASVTCWQIPALRLARALRIKNVSASLKKASAWLASITNEKGKVGYQGMDHFPNGYYALTAAGMFAQLLIGWETDEVLIQNQEKVLLQKLPQIYPTGYELDNDFYYWYFGTLAMFQKGGQGWQKWNQAIKKTLVQNQVPSGPETGSWEPRDRWSVYGGRIYTTAMANLTLQVYYRYSPGEN